MSVLCFVLHLFFCSVIRRNVIVIIWMGIILHNLVIVCSYLHDLLCRPLNVFVTGVSHNHIHAVVYMKVN